MFPVLKILTPKVLKGIMEYVFEKNNLDDQMEMVLHRIDKLENTEYILCKQLYLRKQKLKYLMLFMILLKM
jgi:hypothetical protein